MDDTATDDEDTDETTEKGAVHISLFSFTMNTELCIQFQLMQLLDQKYFDPHS